MRVCNLCRKPFVTKVIVALIVVSVAFPVSAGRWKLRKSLNVRTYSTGNLFLTGEDQVNSTVLAVSPGIYLTRRGGRGRMRLAYTPSLNFYLDDSSLDRVAHYLNADMSVELVKNFFFLRAKAGAGQVSRDPLRRTTFDSINNPEGLSNTFYFSITPDFRGPFLRAGRYARFRIQPGVNFSQTQDGLNSTVGRSTRVNVFSGPAFSRTPWSLNYGNDIFDSDTDDGFGRVDGRIGWRIDDSWRLDLTLGYDEGNYTSNSSTSGFRWRSTVTYRPTSRSMLSLGIGEAFFGDDWILRFNHRHKHSVWNISYDRNIENARQEILNQQFIPLEDAFGEPIEDPVSGQELGVFVASPALIDAVYLRDNLSARWSWFRGRSGASLTAWINRRDYQSFDLDERDGRLTLNLTRRLAPRTTGNADLQYWNHSEEATGLNDFDQYAISMRLSHQFTQSMRVGVRYAYTQRSSNLGVDDFSDNLLNFDFNFSFDR